MDVALAPLKPQTAGLAIRATLAAPEARQTPVTSSAPGPATPLRGSHAASAVALAPAAMTVLLQAQEQGGEALQGAAHAESVQKIDRLIARLSENPPPPAPQVQPGVGGDGGVSMAMLLAARQHLQRAWAAV